MAIVRLSLANPASNTNTLLHTATRQSLVSVIATNTASATAEVDIWVQPVGASVVSQYAYLARNTVLPGNNSLETFRFALETSDQLYVRSTTASVSFSINAIHETSGNYNKVFVTETMPTAVSVGDVWVNQTIGYVKFWTGSVWVNAVPGSAGYAQTTEPAFPEEGQLWVDLDGVPTTEPDFPTVFYTATAPTGLNVTDAGSIWTNSGSNVVNVWTGTSWIQTSIDASSVATGTLAVARGGTGTTTSTGSGSVVLSNASTLSGLTTASALAVTNNLTVNTNTLHVDSVNNRVGIGTTSPISKIHVRQDSGSNDAIRIEGFNGGGGLIYRNESDGAIRIDAVQQGFSSIVFRNTPSGGSLTERMQIDSSGRVTMPFQPTFFASPTNTSGSGIATSFGNLSNNGFTIVSSSRITVPINGAYLITFNTISNSSTGRVDANIRLNGGEFVNMLSEDNGSGFHYRSASIVRRLSANDYIEFNNANWYNSTTLSDPWRTCSIIFLG